MQHMKRLLHVVKEEKEGGMGKCVCLPHNSKVFKFYLWLVDFVK